MPPRVPAVELLIGIDDVWLLLGDERRFDDPAGEGETLPIVRVGIALRLAAGDTGEGGISETVDCVRLVTAFDLIVVVDVVPFLLDVGMTVGRRIPPFDGFSVLGGGAGGGGD